MILTGCATPPQTRQLLQDQHLGLNTPSDTTTNSLSLQSSIELNAVPFWPQTQYQCGPAALAMALNTQGVKVTPEELTPRLYIPKKLGAITPEMLAATRFYQHIPVKLNGTLRALVRQLNAGHPIIVLQNLGLDILPKWHFAMVIGINFNAQQWILHSGEEAFRRMDFGVFERTWARGNYWSMIVMSPNEIPSIDDLNAYGLAMVDFEQLGQVDMARQGYMQMLKADSKHFMAQMGLANLDYQQGNFEKARVGFESLTTLYATNQSIWNNLAYSYVHLNLPKQALAAIAKAVKLSNSNVQFLESEKEINNLILKSSKLK